MSAAPVHFVARELPGVSVADMARSTLGIDYPYWLGGATNWAAQTYLELRRHRDRITLGAEAMAGGRRLWRTSYEDIGPAGAVRLPGTIRFAERDGSFDDGVEIKLKDRTLNQEPPAGSFELAPQPGVAVKDVGCGP